MTVGIIKGQGGLFYLGGGDIKGDEIAWIGL
jgi:hypothetical protein